MISGKVELNICMTILRVKPTYLVSFVRSLLKGIVDVMRLGRRFLLPLSCQVIQLSNVGLYYPFALSRWKLIFLNEGLLVWTYCTTEFSLLYYSQFFFFFTLALPTSGVSFISYKQLRSQQLAIIVFYDAKSWIELKRTGFDVSIPSLVLFA